MPQTLRCKTWLSHRNWQDHCEKARAVQIDSMNLSRADRWHAPLGQEGNAAVWGKTLAQPRFPRGRANDLNNASKMIAGVVKTQSWHTSGGLQSTYACAFGPPRKDAAEWEKELAALRADSFPPRSRTSPATSSLRDGATCCL
mmetsp:Transcript_32863/g.61611  ORF Transcript_32863/g.61611 Transcript_32863/m.61611 type:complete len:143 (+) Transcript_32863:94-522(+)